MLWPCHAGQGGGCTWSTIWVDYASENRVPQSEYPTYVNFPYNSKDNKNTMQVYLVTGVIALEAGQSSHGQKYTLSFYHLSCLCHPACVVPPLLGDRDIKVNIPPLPTPASNAQQSEGCYL